MGCGGPAQTAPARVFWQVADNFSRAIGTQRKVWDADKKGKVYATRGLLSSRARLRFTG
jgi:hypothetical protein